MTFNPINVSPFATNVLDLIGKELTTRDGKKVEVKHSMYGFSIYIDGVLAQADIGDNVSASYRLNQLEVGVAS